MKYTLPILALVASAYCAPLPQLTTTIDHVIPPAVSLDKAITGHLDVRKRVNVSDEQEGEPTFYDAGNPATLPGTVQHQDVSSSGAAQPAASASPTLGQVGAEVGAALGTTLKPVLEPVLDLTDDLDITKRDVQTTNDSDPECEPGSLPSKPPAFGQPTKHNPDPNSDLLPNAIAPKGQTPKTGPTMADNGAVKSSGSAAPATTKDQLISASITLKNRAVQADKREQGFAAVVLENGLVGGATEGLTAGSRARSLKH